MTRVFFLGLVALYLPRAAPLPTSSSGESSGPDRMSPLFASAPVWTLGGAQEQQSMTGVMGGTDEDTTDHSATVEKLTKSYFLNDDFWFTVPGGRMMQTFKDAPKGDTYDNAMGVQFMIRQESTVDHGKDILNAFANQMYCEKSDDGWRGKDTTASGEEVQLFRRFWQGGSWQADYVTGNNIFVGLAFAHASTVLAQDENAACYALAAYDIADAIWETRKCDLHDFPRDRGVSGAGGGGTNTESMADWVGLLNTLNQHGEYKKQVAGMVKFYEKAYNKDDPSYFTGMSCNAELSGSDAGFGNVHPADTTFWSSMADAALSGTDYSENMINAMKNVIGQVDVTEQSNMDTYQGFDYNGIKFSTGGNAIQWELTASAGAMSMMHSLYKHNAQMQWQTVELLDLFQSRKTAYIDSITHLIETSGYIPGSVQSGGSYQYVGLGWSYPPKAHLSASAWSGLALLMDNASDKDALNVFAAQKGMLSRAQAQHGCANIKQTLAKCN